MFIKDLHAEKKSFLIKFSGDMTQRAANTLGGRERGSGIGLALKRSLIDWIIGQ